MISTRVCVDETFLGPYDAQVSPGHLWNGWLSPRFTLDTVREMAARTLELFDEYGDDVDTVHVMNGGTNSQGEPQAVVILIAWQWYEAKDPQRCITVVEPNADGLYSVGGSYWTWEYACWTCACGSRQEWHLTDCEGCDLTRDTQPEKKPCGCGCDPKQGACGEYDLTSPASLAHLAATGRYLRRSEQS